MKFLRKLSIRNKLILIILFVTIVIMTIGVIIVGSDFVGKQKSELLNQYVFQAKIIGEYCITPMTFGDKKAVNEILSKSRSISDIVSIRILDENLETIASFNKDSNLEFKDIANTNSERRFVDGYLTIREPIVYLGEDFGLICMIVSTSKLSEKIQIYFLKFTLIIIILLAIAYLMAVYFQRLISKPILELSEITNRISKNADYSLKLEKKSDDEIGKLYDNFNNMLMQIHNRQQERDKAEKRLEKEKTRAEQSDRLKSAFLANMSHEIRTPMNSISGFSELLEDDELDKERRTKYISIIRTNCDALSQLINDIIDIAKIEADQLNINIGHSSINDLLQEIFLIYKENAAHQKKDIEIKMVAVEKNITIFTDEFRLRQVLLNLIGNAFKFTKEGLIEFGCNLFNEDLLFYVKDTGIGIPKEEKNVIFNRFRQADGSHTRKYGGTGLGLSISKSIIELLGGKIWVDTEVGVGSTFYFTIPYKEVDTSENQIKSMPAGQVSYDWSDKKILIVEDNPTNYQFLKEILVKTNAKIVKAVNGKQAIEVFKENADIELVLMDINLPILNGYEATKAIKKINKNVPVISLTAFAMAGEKELSIEAGCDDYITKPIKSELLFSKINKFFTVE
ncbi:MAG: response regulator [Saprospiraceae bacterium]|nr:response regulator [Saprospiraceae bacterium]